MSSSGFTFLTLPWDQILHSSYVRSPLPVFSSPTFLSSLTVCDWSLGPVSPFSSADDHLLLLCSSLQWQVFEEENRAAVRLLAGDNVEISRSLDPCSFNQFIPVNNFLHCRSARLSYTSFFLLFNCYQHLKKSSRRDVSVFTLSNNKKRLETKYKAPSYERHPFTCAVKLQVENWESTKLRVCGHFRCIKGWN